jgi:flagellar hook-length control protein FliK
MNSSSSPIQIAGVQPLQPQLPEVASEPLPATQFSIAMASIALTEPVDVLAETGAESIPVDITSNAALAFLASALWVGVPLADAGAVESADATCDLPDIHTAPVPFNAVTSEISEAITLPSPDVPDTMVADSPQDDVAVRQVLLAGSAQSESVVDSGSRSDRRKSGPGAVASEGSSAIRMGQGREAQGPLSSLPIINQLLQAGATGDRAASGQGGQVAPPRTEFAVTSPSGTPIPATESTHAGSTPAATSDNVIRSAVATPRWSEEVANKVMLMAVRGQQEGSLTLTPEHLGPLEVRITVSQDTANVWFGAQHADTRAALTEAMPRLRELLATSGLALGHAGVAPHSNGQQGRSAEPRLNSGSEALDRVEPTRDATPLTRLRLSLLDVYA